jgi:hypothetical protein
VLNANARHDHDSLKTAKTLANSDNAALLRPLPYTAPGHLVAVYENRTTRSAGFGTLANANFVDLRANAPSFEDIAAHTSTGLSLTGASEVEQLLGLSFSDIRRRPSSVFRQANLPRSQCGRHWSTRWFWPEQRL